MGPTGSGKTTLAHQIAKNTNAEIISADSMAIYRQMNIGTAKPTKEEQEEVPYHLINIREPWETYNTGNFVQDTAQYIQEIRQRHRPARRRFARRPQRMYSLAESTAYHRECREAQLSAERHRTSCVSWSPGRHARHKEQPHIYQPDQRPGQ